MEVGIACPMGDELARADLLKKARPMDVRAPTARTFAGRICENILHVISPLRRSRTEIPGLTVARHQRFAAPFRCKQTSIVVALRSFLQLVVCFILFACEEVAAFCPQRARCLEFKPAFDWPIPVLIVEPRAFIRFSQHRSLTRVGENAHITLMPDSAHWWTLIIAIFQ